MDVTYDFYLIYSKLKLFTFSFLKHPIKEVFYVTLISLFKYFDVLRNGFIPNTKITLFSNSTKSPAPGLI